MVNRIHDRFCVDAECIGCGALTRPMIEEEAKEAFEAFVHPMKFIGNPGLREIAESWYIEGYFAAAIP